MIEPGTVIAGGPWFDGELRDDYERRRHRWAGRDDAGLGVAACGVRQEDRSNGWAIVNEHNRCLNLPVCEACERVASDATL
jgi:hypothetical protein